MPSDVFSINKISILKSKYESNLKNSKFSTKPHRILDFKPRFDSFSNKNQAYLFN